MKRNVGGADRALRLIVGVVLIAVGLWAPLEPLWQGVAFVVAAIAIITGLIQFCPLNALIGLDTTRHRT